MTSTLAAAVILASLMVAGLVIAARALDAAAWARSLKSYRLTPPSGLSVDDVAAWLGRIAASTHASRFGLLPMPPVALSVVATPGGIAHELAVPTSLESAVLSGLRATLPGVRIEELTGSQAATSFRPLVAAEARLRGGRRPLAVERAEDTSAHLLASLLPLASGESIRLTWIITGAGTPAPVRSDLPVSGGPLDLLGANYQIDSDELRAARLKQRSPQLHTVLRVGVMAGNRPAAYRLFGRIWGALRGMNAPGAMVVRRLLPSFVVAARMQQSALPLLRWPFLVGSVELAGLLGLPFGGVQLPGVSRGSARQLPPATSLPTTGAVVGVSNYVGMSDRPLALRMEDRLRHLWTIGPTGTGKSTLLANLIVKDMAAGRGVVVVDPKGDLVTDVLARVPAARRDDVVLLDPSATDRPVGLNVLGMGGDEQARELAVDHLVHVMASLWRSSFGPRTTDVLRNSLLTLIHTRAADGSAHTLVELTELLLNPRYRAFVTRQATVPPSVRPFWQAYEQMSDNERAQVIGPSLNKIRSFTTRTSLRLMLGQSQGVRLSDVFTARRILLVPLAAGRLGSETTALLGSLLMAGLWSATQERVAVPVEQRHPIFVYLDEFQTFMRLDVELAEMLAAARGYGVGLVLSHQYLSQLGADIKAAVLGTVRTQLAFALERDDARALAPRFAPLTEDDLSGLPAYEIALRAAVNGTTLTPATGKTLPLSPAIADPAVLAERSRQRYGVPRADVEQALAARLQIEHGHARLGRQTRPGELA
jgi:Type IV secretion-system coupling protein DNA-binding domain